ncbi:hypothetical protein SAMN04489760_1131 [Syntrophus gentianae]|uniref:Uncharacterized protein n=1 Tax=Syntrophus gentianae TaxID=43775 RepID=A0A1H7XZV2_9BACT|nr:hypothetical protein SAMN04489760_1131 [Syntrophus gentianae]
MKFRLLAENKDDIFYFLKFLTPFKENSNDMAEAVQAYPGILSRRNFISCLTG